MSNRKTLPGVSGDWERGRNEAKRTAVLPGRAAETKPLFFGNHNGSHWRLQFVELVGCKEGWNMSYGVGQCMKSSSASLTLFFLSMYSFDQHFFVNSTKCTSGTHKIQIDLHVCHRIYTLGESHECFSCMILSGTLILPLFLRLYFCKLNFTSTVFKKWIH